MLDTVRAIETPEGITLGVRPAGPVVRAWAWLVDTFFRGTISSFLAVPFLFFGEAGMGLWLVAVFLLEWLYPVLGEVYLQGATPGKHLFGLRVIHADGTPVAWSASLLRNLLRFADFFPMAYGTGLVCMTLDRDFRRLGDLAAGTLVVYKDSEVRVPSVMKATPTAPMLPLSIDEQRAIVAFSERTPRWTDARARELADLLTRLTGGKGDEAVRRLHGLASWLVGNR